MSVAEGTLQDAVTAAFLRLAPKQQRVARFMAANEGLIAFTPAAEIARRLDVDPATVVRLARALGFKGYPDLQQHIRARIPHHYPSLEATGHDQPGTGPLERAIAQGRANLQMTGEVVAPTLLDEVVGAVAEARRVFVFGSGVASGVVLFLASSLQTMGVAAEGEIGEGLSAAQRLTLLDARDLAIGVGFYRYVRQTVRLLADARAAGLPTIALTDSPLSPLARAADRSLCAPVESISHRVSLVGPCALADALIAAYAVRYPQEVAASLRRLDARYRAAGLLVNH